MRTASGPRASRIPGADIGRYGTLTPPPPEFVLGGEAPCGAMARDERASNIRLGHMLDDQARFGRRAAALLRASREFAADLDCRRIHQIAVDAVEQTFDGAIAMIAEFDPVQEAWTFEALGAKGAVLATGPRSFGAEATSFSHDVLASRVVRRYGLTPSAGAFDQALADAGLTSYVAVPASRSPSGLAVLVAAWAGGYVARPEEVRFLETLALQVSQALQNATLREACRQSAHALRQAQDKACQASRLQALGQVASGVAHDFNNALTTILGLSDWLVQEMAEGAPHRGDLESIRTAAQDAAAMVRRLQMFGRLAPGRGQAEPREIVDLSDIARAVADLVRPRCQELAVRTGRHFGVVVEAESGPTVVASAAEMRELLINLVFNGLDAMPDGGVLRIQPRLRDGCAELAVIDAGIGMSAEVKARVFEPFFSTKGQKGNGLGLSVCASIADRHGATLIVESEPGAGSTFVLSFATPPSANAASACDVTPAAEATPALRRLDVLVVDDEPDVCDSLAAMVSAQGHGVAVSHGGATALALLEQRRFDIVVTDLGMPGMNGLDLARQVVSTRPSTSVVLVTAWGVDFGSELPAEVSAVVAKPTTMRALQEAFSAAVAGGPGRAARQRAAAGSGCVARASGLVPILEHWEAT